MVRQGKTPVPTAEETWTLLDSIDVTTLIGLRDRAIVALMTYPFARVGALLKMLGEDYDVQGERGWVRLHEKGGKEHPMPCHHNLQDYLDAYVTAAGIDTEICCHTFRATGITTYLKNGGQLELAQRMADHESARTTGLYDRRNDEVSLDEIERIQI